MLVLYVSTWLLLFHFHDGGIDFLGYVAAQARLQLLFKMHQGAGILFAQEARVLQCGQKDRLNMNMSRLALKHKTPSNFQLANGPTSRPRLFIPEQVITRQGTDLQDAHGLGFGKTVQC